MNRLAVNSCIQYPAPEVSVITPVFNGEQWLGEALDSALAQSFESLEIIVVNDGSSDSSLDIAHRHARRSQGRIKVINQANAGLPAARNVALGHARGQYFALLDADDAWEPHHLRIAMAAFEQDPDLGLVHANIERVNGQGQRIDIPKRHWTGYGDAFEAIALRLEHVSCPTAVFSRSAMETVGCFDPQFTGLGCEDRDLWLRIASRFRIRYMDHVTARYRVHRASMSSDLERMARARQLLITKLAQTNRGAQLVPRMEAMLISDLGLGLLHGGSHVAAIKEQWKAFCLVPMEPEIRRRLARSLLRAIQAWSTANRWRAGQEETS